MVWWSGKYIGERAREWTRLLTDGQGVYCTTQQEDNATYEALKRAASVKRVDLSRVAALRAGSDFDRPYEEQSASDNLLNYATQGGFAPAIQNLYRAGNPVVQEIVTYWGVHGAKRCAAALTQAVIIAYSCNVTAYRHELLKWPLIGKTR